MNCVLLTPPAAMRLAFLNNRVRLIKQTDNIVAIVHIWKGPTEQFLSEFKNKVKDVIFRIYIAKGNRRNI